MTPRSAGGFLVPACGFALGAASGRTVAAVVSPRSRRRVEKWRRRLGDDVARTVTVLIG